MDVLITGVTGFLGGHVARLLDRLPYFRVTGLGTRHPAAVHLPPRVRYTQQAVEDLRPEDAVAPETSIVHAAATSDVAYALRSPRRALQDTLGGTLAVLTAGVKGRVVLLSSQSVYGGGEGPLSESAPLRPRSLYGALKAAQEHLALAYWHSRGVPVVILRLSNVYGPFERPGALVRSLLSAALRREPIPVEGDGTQTRSLLFCEDFARAVHLALTGPEALVGRAWNVAGPSLSIGNLAAMCGWMAGFEEIAHGPARAHEEGPVELDASAFRALTGWEPQVPLALGLEKTAAWLWTQHPGQPTPTVPEDEPWR